MIERAIAHVAIAALALVAVGACERAGPRPVAIVPEPAPAPAAANARGGSRAVEAGENARALPEDAPCAGAADSPAPLEVAVRRVGNPLDSPDTISELGQVVTDPQRCEVTSCAVVDADAMRSLVERMRPGLEARSAPTSRSPHYLTTVLEIEWRDRRCAVEDSWDVSVVDADRAAFQDAVEALSDAL